jgi:hypothetical protein
VGEVKLKNMANPRGIDKAIRTRVQKGIKKQGAPAKADKLPKEITQSAPGVLPKVPPLPNLPKIDPAKSSVNDGMSVKAAMKTLGKNVAESSRDVELKTMLKEVGS